MLLKHTYQLLLNFTDLDDDEVDGLTLELDFLAKRLNSLEHSNHIILLFTVAIARRIKEHSYHTNIFLSAVQLFFNIPSTFIHTKLMHPL